MIKGHGVRYQMEYFETEGSKMLNSNMKVGQNSSYQSEMCELN